MPIREILVWLILDALRRDDNDEGLDPAIAEVIALLSDDPRFRDDVGGANRALLVFPTAGGRAVIWPNGFDFLNTFRAQIQSLRDDGDFINSLRVDRVFEGTDPWAIPAEAVAWLRREFTV